MRLKLSGVIATTDKNDWRLCPDAPEVGWYMGQPTTKTPSGIPCPYCKVAMTKFGSDNPKRIVRMLDRVGDTFTVLAQPIPRTHRVVGCYHCRTHFTVPCRGAYRG